MRFPKGRWTSKLLRLRSLQVDLPIHSTKNNLNVLAKTQKSPHIPKKKAELARMISICSIWLISSILSFSFPQPRSRGPAAVFEPSHLHLRSGSSPGWLLLWSCWPETRRQGPAQVAKSRTKSWWTVKAFHCSCAELPALSTGPHVCLFGLSDTKVPS